MLAPKSFRRIPLYRFKGIEPMAKRPVLPIAVTEQGLGFPRRKNTPSNILFCYQYRDAANYKLNGEAIFSNHTFLPLADIEQQLRSCLKDGEFFIARQVNIEERFFDALHDDDNPGWNNRFAWHEFERVEVTTLTSFDPENWTQKQHRRDISEFIAELEQANKAGWDVMNVCADMAQLQAQQKAAPGQRLRKSA
jgi:hypothetical protein